MRFDVVTIFPAMVRQALDEGIVGRAIERKTLEVVVHDLRDFTTDRHRVVDDVPYGGGPGMVLKPEPLFRALDAIEAQDARTPLVLLTSPQGTRLTQRVVERFSQQSRLVLLCGRYEGIDERVRSRVHEEVSIGDYVLSGGELPALVIIDAVARLVPGVVGDEQSVAEDSFGRGLLDFPHYTRRQRFRRGRLTKSSRCPTCCCRAITPRFGAGENGKRSHARSRDAPTCWTPQVSTTKNRCCYANSGQGVTHTRETIGRAAVSLQDS